MKKKKYLIIFEPVYRNKLNVFLNYSFEELNKFFKKRGYGLLDEKFKQDGGVCFIQFREGQVPCFTIWIQNFKWTLGGQATLLHELSHYIFAVMNYKGIPINNAETDANETYAYLLEYFFYELSRRISKFN